MCDFNSHIFLDKKNGKREKEKKNGDYSTVQVKLNTLLRPNVIDDVRPLFDGVANKISAISYEAYQLANFHVLRLLSENAPLPSLNQSFFYSCCALYQEIWR